MVETATLVPFITLLFLVVIELSGQLNDVDLPELARSKNGWILGIIPRLGFFSLVHLLNVFLLMIGYLVLAIELIRGVQGTSFIILLLLFVATGAFVVYIPYLEIENYDNLMISTGSRWSLLWHVVMSIFILLEPLIFIYIVFTNPSDVESLGSILLVLIYVLGNLMFLRAINRELLIASSR